MMILPVAKITVTSCVKTTVIMYSLAILFESGVFGRILLLKVNPDQDCSLSFLSSPLRWRRFGLLLWEITAKSFIPRNSFQSIINT